MHFIPAILMRSGIAVLECTAIATTLTLAFAAQAQSVTSFADVAGSWRGHGLQTGIDTVIVIGADGSWTTSSRIGSESGKGKIVNGAFLLEWKDGYGKMEITRTGQDSIVAKSQWYSGTRWVNGQVNATRCTKDDCTDKGPKF